MVNHGLARTALAGTVVALAFADAGSPIAQAQGTNMNQDVNIADRRELFVDRFLIERMDNASLRLHEPVSGGIAIKIDKPWEGPVNFGHAVIRLDGRYVMYYRAMKVDEDTSVLCVATSDDGVTWTKPALGLVERAGRRDTNIIADESGQALQADIWHDTRPGVRADQRVKALVSTPLSGEKHTEFRDPPGPKRMVVWASADGFSFRKLAPQPEIVSRLVNSFDGGNTMFWSEAEQAYVFYYRFMDGRRTIARMTSKDFLHWSDPVPMTYGDTPREQFYTNNAEPYFRALHLYVALAARFMEGRRVVTDAQVQAIGLRTSKGYSFANDCSDAVLLTSRAGSAQYDRTFMEGFVRPGPGGQNWVSRTNYPLTGVFPCGPDRMMFWVSRHYMQDTWHVERLLLRLDGFASVTAPWAGGEVLTKPLIFAGKELEINYRTSAAGSIRVELQDAAGKPIPGYTQADCPEVIGDEVARTVAWKQGADLSRLAGQGVRLRFVMKDADLFSLKFQ